jgi:hypothetical protein
MCRFSTIVVQYYVAYYLRRLIDVNFVYGQLFCALCQTLDVIVSYCFLGCHCPFICHIVG